MELSCEPFPTNAECFCDDCHNRMRIAQRMETGAFNRFAPSGGVFVTGIAAHNITITRGRQHIAFFRAAVKNRGTQFCCRETRSATAYARCCGTLCWHAVKAHPHIVDLDPQHLEGWVQGPTKWYFNTNNQWTGVPVPTEVPIAGGRDRTGVAKADVSVGSLAKVAGIALSGLVSRVSKPPSEVLLDWSLYVAGCMAIAGRPVSYIEDPTLLFATSTVALRDELDRLTRTNAELNRLVQLKSEEEYDLAEIVGFVDDDETARASRVARSPSNPFTV